MIGRRVRVLAKLRGQPRPLIEYAADFGAFADLVLPLLHDPDCLRVWWELPQPVPEVAVPAGRLAPAGYWRRGEDWWAGEEVESGVVPGDAERCETP